MTPTSAGVASRASLIPQPFPASRHIAALMRNKVDEPAGFVAADRSDEAPPPPSPRARS